MKRIGSGGPWEDIVGYSRAVRVGAHIVVAGTTATDESGNVVGVGDAYAQARRAFENALAAVRALGGGVEHVVRTRMYVTDASRWQEVGRAHSELFGHVRPAATLVEVRALVAPELLVEVELDAIVAEPT
ncbi:MAG: RidA family protein [Myxococcales bacterium]|nr:RidA family protein [Myxococcales bacterium]MCB9582301.1 RidA family protein [Polyangiaceae bacterium]